MESLAAIDPFALNYWLNTRKLTPGMLAARTGLSVAAIHRLLQDDQPQLPSGMALRLADCLNIHLRQLTQGKNSESTVIHLSAAALLASRRTVQRDGIPFYNYYTLPSPRDNVAPVVIDVLCPSDRLPKLNNGHLEPAITVNLGPGHIHARWGDELNASTWRTLRSNTTDCQPWIVGDSYIEPSYGPHAYSLAAGQAAQIISYTSWSPLARILSDSNYWPEHAFQRMADDLTAYPAAGSMLRASLERRGYDVAALTHLLSADGNAVAAYLEGRADALDVTDLKRIGIAVGFDYRLVLAPAHKHDDLGMIQCSIEESIATVRRFKSYTVASMAAAPEFTDLIGMFMLVDKQDVNAGLDLSDHGASHYFVTAGSLTVYWLDADGSVLSRALGRHDSFWIGPCVSHALAGKGSLIKLGTGEGYSYLDRLEMSNTYDLRATLRRGRRDRAGWGYDPTGTTPA